MAFDVEKGEGPSLLLVDSLANGVIGVRRRVDSARFFTAFARFPEVHPDETRRAHLIHREARPEDRDVEFVALCPGAVLKEEDE